MKKIINRILIIVLTIIISISSIIMVCPSLQKSTQEENSMVIENIVVEEKITTEVENIIIEESNKQEIVELTTTEEEQQKETVYTTTEVNLRKTPDLNGEVIKVLNVNTELIKIKDIDNWSVILYNDEECYIYTQYISKDKTIIKPKEVKISSRGGDSLRDTQKVENNSNKTYMGKYKLTAYCGCSKCCGKSDGITACGTKAAAGRTIAAPFNFSFGTKLEINGHTYTVEDRGGAIKGNRIDVFFNSHSEALNFGVKYADVYKVN